jgi:hypothetical protein
MLSPVFFNIVPDMTMVLEQYQNESDVVAMFIYQAHYSMLGPPEIAKSGPAGCGSGTPLVRGRET